MSIIDDIRNLDTQNVGGWPKSVKTLFAVLLIVLIVLGGWWFLIRPQQEELDRLVSKEGTLKADFSKKQSRVVNLPALRKQLEDMNEILRQMLRQLPSKTDMPDLLVDISQTALAAGIETELFQPGGEKILTEDFYAEKPIQLKMVGSYHQFGTFISGVASLPRVVILTLHDVSLKPAERGAGQLARPGNLLVLEGTVKTYRYVDDDEAAAINQAEAAKATAAGGRKAPPPRPAPKPAGGK